MIAYTYIYVSVSCALASARSKPHPTQRTERYNPRTPTDALFQPHCRTFDKLRPLTLATRGPQSLTKPQQAPTMQRRASHSIHLPLTRTPIRTAPTTSMAL